MTKTTVATSAAILLLMTAWAANAQNPQAPPENKLVKITNSLYVLDGDGGNTSVYLTDEGVILVDVKFERDYDDIMAKVKSLTDKPVRYVINTHSHTDHTGGNVKFAGKAQIVAHDNALTNMITHKTPGLPTITFSDSITLHLGGKEVVAQYFAGGHSDCSISVYFPAEKVVATGDAFVGGEHTGHIDYPTGGSVRNYVKTLDGILAKWDFNTVIPGHGPACKREDLAKSRDKFENVIARVTAMVGEGANKDTISKMLISEFGWNPTGQGIRNDVPGLMNELKR